MKSIDDEMLLIKALDRNASLMFSETTSCWYVSARIHVSDGTMLHSCTEHRATPEEAVLAFVRALQTLPTSEFIVINELSVEERREYRWNGAAWVDITGERVRS